MRRTNSLFPRSTASMNDIYPSTVENSWSSLEEADPWSKGRITREITGRDQRRMHQKQRDETRGRHELLLWSLLSERRPKLKSGILISFLMGWRKLRDREFSIKKHLRIVRLMRRNFIYGATRPGTNFPSANTNKRVTPIHLGVRFLFPGDIRGGWGAKWIRTVL